MSHSGPKYGALLGSLAARYGCALEYSLPELVSGGLTPPPSRVYPGTVCYMMTVQVGGSSYHGFGPTPLIARHVAEFEAYRSLKESLSAGDNQSHAASSPMPNLEAESRATLELEDDGLAMGSGDRECRNIDGTMEGSSDVMDNWEGDSYHERPLDMPRKAATAGLRVRNEHTASENSAVKDREQDPGLIEGGTVGKKSDAIAATEIFGEVTDTSTGILPQSSNTGGPSKHCNSFTPKEVHVHRNRTQPSSSHAQPGKNERFCEIPQVFQKEYTVPEDHNGLMQALEKVPPDTDCEERESAFTFTGTGRSDIANVALLAARQRGLNLCFKISSIGPPYAKQVLAKAVCGEMEFEGRHTKKKVARAIAAKKLLDALERSPSRGQDDIYSWQRALRREFPHPHTDVASTPMGMRAGGNAGVIVLESSQQASPERRQDRARREQDRQYHSPVLSDSGFVSASFQESDSCAPVPISDPIVNNPPRASKHGDTNPGSKTSVVNSDSNVTDRLPCGKAVDKLSSTPRMGAGREGLLAPASSMTNVQQSSSSEYESDGALSVMSLPISTLRQRMTGRGVSSRNPIGQLQEVMMKEQHCLPVYAEAVESVGKYTEYICVVSAKGLSAKGVGCSKKLARRHAAENMLAVMEGEGMNTNPSLIHIENRFKKLMRPSSSRSRPAVSPSSSPLQQQPVRHQGSSLPSPSSPSSPSSPCGPHQSDQQATPHQSNQQATPHQLDLQATPHQANSQLVPPPQTNPQAPPPQTNPQAPPPQTNPQAPPPQTNPQAPPPQTNPQAPPPQANPQAPPPQTNPQAPPPQANPQAPPPQTNPQAPPPQTNPQAPSPQTNPQAPSPPSNSQAPPPQSDPQATPPANPQLLPSQQSNPQAPPPPSNSQAPPPQSDPQATPPANPQLLPSQQSNPQAPPPQASSSQQSHPQAPPHHPDLQAAPIQTPHQPYLQLPPNVPYTPPQQTYPQVAPPRINPRTAPIHQAPPNQPDPPVTPCQSNIPFLQTNPGISQTPLPPLPPLLNQSNPWGPPHRSDPQRPPYQSNPQGPPNWPNPQGPPHQGPPNWSNPQGPPHQGPPNWPNPQGPPHQGPPNRSNSQGPPHQGPPNRSNPQGPPHQGPPNRSNPQGPPHQGPPNRSNPQGPPHQGPLHQPDLHAKLRHNTPPGRPDKLNSQAPPRQPNPHMLPHRQAAGFFPPPPPPPPLPTPHSHPPRYQHSNYPSLPSHPTDGQSPNPSSHSPSKKKSNPRRSPRSPMQHRPTESSSHPAPPYGRPYNNMPYGPPPHRCNPRQPLMRPPFSRQEIRPPSYQKPLLPTPGSPPLRMPANIQRPRPPEPHGPRPHFPSPYLQPQEPPLNPSNDMGSSLQPPDYQGHPQNPPRHQEPLTASSQSNSSHSTASSQQASAVTASLSPTVYAFALNHPPITPTDSESESDPDTSLQASPGLFEMLPPPSSSHDCSTLINSVGVDESITSKNSNSATQPSGENSARESAPKSSSPTILPTATSSSSIDISPESIEDSAIGSPDIVDSESLTARKTEGEKQTEVAPSRPTTGNTPPPLHEEQSEEKEEAVASMTRDSMTAKEYSDDAGTSPLLSSENSITPATLKTSASIVQEAQSTSPVESGMEGMESVTPIGKHADGEAMQPDVLPECVALGPSTQTDYQCSCVPPQRDKAIKRSWVPLAQQITPQYPMSRSDPLNFSVRLPRERQPWSSVAAISKEVLQPKSTLPPWVGTSPKPCSKSIPQPVSLQEAVSPPGMQSISSTSPVRQLPVHPLLQMAQSQSQAAGGRVVAPQQVSKACFNEHSSPTCEIDNMMKKFSITGNVAGDDVCVGLPTEGSLADLGSILK